MGTEVILGAIAKEGLTVVLHILKEAAMRKADPTPEEWVALLSKVQEQSYQDYINKANG